MLAAAGSLVAGLCVVLIGFAGAAQADRVASLLSAAVAAVSAVVLIVHRAPPGNWHRQVLGVAMLVWSAGQVLNGFDPRVEFPGPGDFVSLAAGPLAVLGGVQMLRVRSGVAGMVQLAVDGVLLGLALALPIWQFGLADATTQAATAAGRDGWLGSQGAALGVLIALAMLVGGAVLAYLRDLDRHVLLVAAGLSIYAVGDLLAMHGAIVGRWSWAGSVLVCMAFPLIGAGLIAYRPTSPADRDRAELDRLEGLGSEDNRSMRVTTGATLTLLVVSLVALAFDPTPNRTSIALVAVAIGGFGVREVVNAHSRRELLVRLQDEATADPLTGLANRRVLAVRMSRLPAGESWCLLTVDLDGFKDVNDLLGHAVGDQLLSAVARRLTESSPADALVSRIGGDEFAVLLQGDIDVGARVGGAIVTAVRQSAADVEGVARVEVSASVGVAAVNRGGATPTLAVVDEPVPAAPAQQPEPPAPEPPAPEPPAPEPPAPEPEAQSAARPENARSATIIDLRDHAVVPHAVRPVSHSATVVDPLGALSASGAALRVAKAAGRNRVEVYDEEIATIRRRRLRVEERLRVAVETDAITVRFQPIVDLRRGVVAGAEALARWTDPELGRVDPGEFITVAEQTGLVVALGERVLEETLGAGVRERLFERGLRLSWNVSPVQLRVAGFDRVVHEAIAAHRVPRELLVMEVTEQVLVEEGQAAQTLHRIAKLGVTIAIDDFGTGYSALGYLHRLPADILKIDQSLTASLVAEPRSRAITRAVLDLGRTVGLSVVVEGVESDQIHDLVRRMGIGYGQGMHYGPAMTAAELGDLADRLTTPTG